MPIDLDLLNEPINRCLVAWPERQLGDVLMELVFRQGEDWWHLVVDLGEGHFAAIQFNKLTSLAESEGLEFFQRALSSLVASVIPDVLVVEQSAIGTQAAKDLADESPGRVLVVTQDGGFFRILYRGEAGGGPAGPSLLDLFLPHADAFRPQEAAIEPPPDGTPPELPPDEAPPDEVHPAEQPRYIQARVADPGALIPYLPLGAPLFSDHSYRLLVRIGLPDGRELARMRQRGELEALRARGIDPLHQEVLPRVLAGGFAVLMLAAVASAVTLVLAYLTVHGFTLGGLERFTRTVGQVFSPAVTLVFMVKTLLLALAVSLVPVASAIHDRPRGRARTGGEVEALVRLLLVMLLIEAVSLAANYA